MRCVTLGVFQVASETGWRHGIRSDGPLSDLQFTIERDVFADAVGWAARALSARPLNPILGGVRLSVVDGGLLQVAAFDYEVSAEVMVDAAITSPGSTLVSGRLLQAITKTLPRKPVEFNVDGPVVQVTCGAAKFTLPTMRVGDFPDLPARPATVGEVDAGQLAEAIGQAACAIHKGDGFNELKSVCFDVDPLGGMTLTATDRYRVATRTIPWQAALPDDQFATPTRLLVPPRALGDIGRLGGGTVTLGFEGDEPRLLSFGGEGRNAITQLIGEEFPTCERLFPTEHTAVATVNTAELTELLGRSLALDERDSPHVRLSFEAGVVRLSGGQSGGGEFREDAAIDFGGEPIDVWLNPKYLLDGLAACRADKVAIGFTTKKRPLVLVASDGLPFANASGPFDALTGEFRYLLMPAQPPVGH